MAAPSLPPTVPAWWIAAGYATVAALAAASATSAWVAQRGRRAVLARLGRPSQRAARLLATGGAALDPFLLGDEDDGSWQARAAAVLARWLPAALRSERAAARLVAAGYFSPTAVYFFGASRLLAPVVAPALVACATGSASPLGLGLGLAAGLVGPTALLDRRAGERRTALGAAIPDALDLLIVCLEAGVGLDAALVRVTRELRSAHPVLAAELDNVSRRTSAGLPREEALRALVARTGVEDLRAIVTTMVQAERLGTSLARVLRIHGESLRGRRKQLAEKRAAEASVKMLIPLVLFLLPAFFAVVLGPAALGLIGTMGGR